MSVDFEVKATGSVGESIQVQVDLSDPSSSDGPKGRLRPSYSIIIMLLIISSRWRRLLTPLLFGTTLKQLKDNVTALQTRCLRSSRRTWDPWYIEWNYSGYLDDPAFFTTMVSEHYAADQYWAPEAAAANARTALQTQRKVILTQK